MLRSVPWSMLVVIIVSWNVRDLLRGCLKSLRESTLTAHGMRIIVVDNASSDRSVDMLRNEFPDALLVANTANRGFTGGNNDGLQAAEALFNGYDPQSSYVLLLNPDTKVLPGALEAMIAYADQHPDIGLLGPQLLYADGTVQSSRRRFIDLPTAIFESTWLQPYAPRHLLDRYYMRECRDDMVCDVDWVYGAAMLVRRSTYLQCGGLDEVNFFMYSEEMDWCKRIKAAPLPTDMTPSSTTKTWRVVYLPAAHIVHYEARSSTQVSAQRDIYFNTSKVRYFRKHHGAAKAALLRLLLLTMFTQQLSLEALKWLAGHKRPLRQARIRAYISVLRSGLR